MLHGDELWHERGAAMPGPPLDSSALLECALAYAARYATTRAKLRRYLQQKLRQRGWAGDGAPDLEGVVERVAAAGAVDDAAYAQAKAGSLARRGYGAARVHAALAAAGVDADTRAAAAQALDADAAAAAYARRRRLGRHRDVGANDRDQARRDMAAMLRAGHAWEAARRALGGEEPDDLPADQPR